MFDSIRIFLPFGLSNNFFTDLAKEENSQDDPAMKLQGLLTWSENQFSDLPWRRNRSLYRTLVSEIMLQQTTVATVRNHFERFLDRFPDLPSLARATEEELTVAWKGLGYYRRARNLKKIAEAIYRDHGGEFPQDRAKLMEIPGIGPYTASALIGIGMDRPALAVDANLERVIARLFTLPFEKGPKLQTDIQRRFDAGEIFATDLSYRSLNEALMDLGRTYCQARKASCELCPLKLECQAFEARVPLKWPATKTALPTTSVAHELHLLRVIVKKNNSVLVYRKKTHEWLAGQFEVPTFILASTDLQLKQYPRLTTDLKPLFSFTTGITKYKIKNSVLVLDEIEFEKLPFTMPSEWRPVAAEDSNFSTATMKALLKLAQS